MPPALPVVVYSVDKPVAGPTDQSSRAGLDQDAMNERNSFDYDRPLSIAASFTCS